MVDEIKKDSEGQNPVSGESTDQQLESRRSFAKSGLAGGAVLMSLLSRPALGTGYNDPRCTGSILASIDAGTSLHDFDPDDCRFGCTPGFWCSGQPPDLRAWQRITNLTGITPSTQFVDLFGCGPAPDPASIALYFPNGTTLDDILCIPNGDGPAFVKQSARHSIAAWLNATIMGVFFGPSPADIITNYCNAYNVWINNGNTNPLSNWHIQMDTLNNRGCPLNNDPSNPFYND